MSYSLTQRLQALAESYKQTLVTISELQNVGSSPTTSLPDADEKRLELGSEIHDSLKEQEDTLELLRQEIDEDEGWASGYRGRYGRDTDHERNADLVARLSEDLKSARAKFRRAQLQAKRNIDIAKRKEAEALFSGRSADQASSQPTTRKKGLEKLTQDELAMNAADDVTRALRRTHELIQGNLQQSQFAQQTLDESQDALKGLAEGYGGTGDLLKNSRGLVTQLVRSSKSDTWFLLTSFWVLAITIGWLIFRRILYGPLWWLVYQPLRLMWWLTLTSLGTIFLGMGEVTNSTALSSTAIITSSVNVPIIPTDTASIQFRSLELPNKGGPAPGGQPQEENMVDKIGRMVEQIRGPSVASDNDGVARNTKKRMFEAEDVEDMKTRKDEL